jgi:hypothetical protein
MKMATIVLPCARKRDQPTARNRTFLRSMQMLSLDRVDGAVRQLNSSRVHRPAGLLGY